MSAGMKKNGELLDDLLTAAIKTGEISYQSNRRALKKIDIQGDPEAGLKEIKLMLTGLDMFVKDLERVYSVAKDVKKRAGATIR